MRNQTVIFNNGTVGEICAVGFQDSVYIAGLQFQYRPFNSRLHVLLLFLSFLCFFFSLHKEFNRIVFCGMYYWLSSNCFSLRDCSNCFPPLSDKTAEPRWRDQAPRPLIVTHSAQGEKE